MTASRALTSNASSGKQVRAAGKRERFDALALERDTKAVMATPEGRRFVWWLLDVCGVVSSVMRDGVERVEYNAGKQDVAHMLQIQVITTDADAYLLMQKEAIDAQQHAQAAVPEEKPGMAKEPSEPESEDDDA